MLFVALLFVVVGSALSMTTTAGPTVVSILYDNAHKTAMIVRTDGCFEYHLNHADDLASQDDAQRPALEARMLDELSQGTNFAEMGHNHINHMTQAIQTACSALPVYSWDVPV